MKSCCYISESINDADYEWYEGISAFDWQQKIKPKLHEPLALLAYRDKVLRIDSADPAVLQVVGREFAITDIGLALAICAHPRSVDTS